MKQLKLLAIFNFNLMIMHTARHFILGLHIKLNMAILILATLILIRPIAKTNSAPNLTAIRYLRAASIALKMGGIYRSAYYLRVAFI